LYSDFSEKLKASASDSGFENISASESKSAYVRIYNPVMYALLTFDISEIPQQQVMEQAKFFAGKIEPQLTAMRCTSLVIICLLYCSNTNDLDNVHSFCDAQEQTYSKVNFVWWYTDGKTLSFGRKQPSKLSGFEKTVQNALSPSYEPKNVTDSAPQKPSGTKAPATAALIAINAVIWLLLNAVDKNIAYLFANNRSAVLEAHQFYRLFTCVFIHVTFIHLFYNCFSLYIFGRLCENLLGWKKYILLYISSGIAASVVSMIFSSGYSIGASGAVYGIMGALLAYAKNRGKNIQGLNYPTLFLFIVTGIGLGFADKSVDNFAHIGGVIFGFLLVYILEKAVKNREN